MRWGKVCKIVDGAIDGEPRAGCGIVFAQFGSSDVFIGAHFPQSLLESFEKLCGEVALSKKKKDRIEVMVMDPSCNGVVPAYFPPA